MLAPGLGFGDWCEDFAPELQVLCCDSERAPQSYFFEIKTQDDIVVEVAGLGERFFSPES